MAATNREDFVVFVTGVTKGLEAALNKALGVAKGTLGKIKELAKKVSEGFKMMGKAMSVAGLAITAALGFATSTAMALGDELQKMSLRTGASVEALSELKHAAELSDTSLEGLDKAMKRMARVVSDAENGLESATRPLGELNLAWQDLMELAPEDQLTTILEALAGVENATKRAALAQEIFGRSGTELLPMLENGAEGLRQMRQEARDLGLTMGQDAADRAAAFGDWLSTLRRQLEALRAKFGDVIIQALLPFREWSQRALAAVIMWTEANPQLVRTIVLVTGAVGILMGILGPALVLLPSLVGGISIALGAIAGVVALINAPLVALIALVGVGLVAAFRNWEGILRRIFGEGTGGGLAARIRDLLGDELTLQQKAQLIAEIFRVLFEQLSNGFRGMVAEASGGWSGVLETAKTTLGGLAELIDWVTGLMTELWTAHGGAISAALGWAWDQIIGHLERAWNVLDTLTTWLADAFFGNWERVWTGIRDAAIGPLETLEGWLTRISRKILELIQKIPLIGNWAVPDLPSFPGGSRPGAAAGGIVTRGGWLNVGERGPEPVMLPAGAEIMPHRPGSSGGGGGGDTFVFNGAVFGVDDMMRKIDDAMAVRQRSAMRGAGARL